MQEASLSPAANKQPHNNNSKSSKTTTTATTTTTTTASTAITTTSKTTPQSHIKNQKLSGSGVPSRPGGNNFELETDNDNWPEVDLGNLIFDLDADIDKTTTTTTTMSSTNTTSATGSGSIPAGATLNVPAVGGGSATATLTESGVSAASAADKSLKMKIKRMKSGSRGNAEGKLEIVQQSESGAGDVSVAGSSPISNGSPDPIGLSAAEIVAVVKQNVKPSGVLASGSSGSSKVRLTSSGSGATGAPTAPPSAPLGGANGAKKSTPIGAGTISTGVGVINSAAVGSVSKANADKSNGSSSNPTKPPFSMAGQNPVQSSSGFSGNNVVAGNAVLATGNGSGSSNAENSKVQQLQQQQSNSNNKHHLVAGNSSNNKPVYAPQSTSKVNNSSNNSNTEPPTKKQKVDASVGTEMGTMTEPDCLGPLDPGTSVTLEGIVWHETDGGVLVINVTWRGKTYVGTLLDSTRHVNQWAPPRYSDSPTSELEGRTPKGRSKRGRGGGTPVETETRKNLRSSKVNNKGRGNNLSQANSPAKRKGRPGEGGDEKRARTDSSRNSPDDDEDSEKEQRESSKEKENNGESDRESTSSAKVKDEKEEDFTPKDKEEERYIPPPPLPFTLVCPKPDCSKRYRHHNGLRYHVSHSHPELLDNHGEIRDNEEIERMETESKVKEEKKFDESQPDTMTDSSASGPSSKTSTPGPSDLMQQQQQNDLSSADPASKMSLMPPGMSGGLGPKLTGPPSDAKPIPVSAIDGVMNSRPPPPILQSPSSGLPPNYKSPSAASISSNVKPIRPPSNARPIVPATGPQLMAGGVALGPSAINLKPIQPRPTIMPDPTPNLSLDELRKSKKDFKKKKDSPGNSPPRNGSQSLAVNGGSPKVGNGKMEAPVTVYGSSAAAAINAAEKAANEAKSPAYSDISDDNEDSSERRRSENPDGSRQQQQQQQQMQQQQQQQQQQQSSLSIGNLVGPTNAPPMGLPQVPPTSMMQQAPPAHFPFSPYAIPGGPPIMSLASQLPTVPVTIPKSDQSSPKLPKKEPLPLGSGGPMPGTVEYEKMLQAYGFPPFPYPIPPGMDPNYHVQLLTADPVYRAKYERERTDKERAFKEQIDRDNREKDRRAGVKIHDEPRRTPEDLRKHGGGSRTPTASPRSGGASSSSSSGMISVKPEFRVDLKQEQKDQKPPVTTVDEGVKPTMETRGPPPSNAFNYLHPAFFRPPGMSYEHLLPPGLLSLPGYGPNPYLAPHLAAAAAAAGFRPPFLPPGAGPEDLSRAAAMAAGGGASATKALDLLHQHASQYYAVNSAANSVSAGLGSPLSAHKIHELHERALKSPSSGKSSPAPPPPGTPSSLSQMTSLSTGTTVTSATTTKSSTDLSGSRNKDIPSPSISSSRLTPTSQRGRSPPPLRHVHTHTHTHYGLGYPLLPPPPGAVPGVPSVPGVGAPPAHSSFPSAGFPASLLPGKPPMPGSLPTFPPTK